MILNLTDVRKSIIKYPRNVGKDRYNEKDIFQQSLLLMHDFQEEKYDLIIYGLFEHKLRHACHMYTADYSIYLITRTGCFFVFFLHS